MWVGGSAIMFVLIMFTFLAWTREGQRASSRGWLEAARRANLADLTAGDAPRAVTSAAAGAGGVSASGAGTGPAPAHRPARPPDIDEDEDQLAAYNAFLARLNQGGETQRR
jgi:hypothetical protein